MKRILGLGAMLAVLAPAETWNGYLSDSMCKGSKGTTNHSKSCVMRCAKSGLGLVTSDGKYLKFDAAGSDKALAALKATNKKEDLKAAVSGSLEGDTIKLESIEIQ